MTLFLAWLCVLGCVPSVVPEQRMGPSRPDGDTAEDAQGHVQTSAIIATVSADFSVGALAQVDIGDWGVNDTLAPISGDPAVVVDDGHVVQLNRFNHDTVRVYVPGDWSAPTLELALADGANPHDADLCGGDLWISQYGKKDLVLVDLSSGLLSGTIDLSAYADGDGLPEMAELVEIEGVLHVAVQRLNRDEGWHGDAGAVVAIDCATREVVDHWPTGPNPSISPLSDGRILVRTGLIGSEDGHLTVLDSVTGDFGTPLLSEADLGRDILSVGSATDKALVISASTDWDFHIGCLDVQTGQYEAAERTTAYLASVSVNDREEAWIAARPGWSDVDAPVGTIVYDLAGCNSLVGDDRIETLLPPFSIGFYP